MKRQVISARGRIIGALLIFAALFGGGAWWLRIGQATTPIAIDYTLVTPQRTTLTATVNAAGRLEPVRVTSLAFAAAGRVVEVLVSPGDTVEAGAVLARLDDRDAQLRITQAEAGLAQVQAGLDRLRGGPSQADVDAARAQVAQAEASLTQVRGSVTGADLRAAAEQVRQAEVRLERILGTPANGDVATADARIREATLALEQQRSQLSAAKSAAATQLEQAVSSLTQAQARYATALANWQHVEAKGTDPLVPSTADPTNPGGTRPNRLSAGQQRQYRDALTQAEASLRSAEEAVAQAQVQFDNARTAEATGVTLAEGQLQVAQEQRGQLFAPADGDQVAAARAQLESARAQLERLRGEQRLGQPRLDRPRERLDTPDAGIVAILEGRGDVRSRGGDGLVAPAGSCEHLGVAAGEDLFGVAEDDLRLLQAFAAGEQGHAVGRGAAEVVERGGGGGEGGSAVGGARCAGEGHERREKPRRRARARAEAGLDAAADVGP